MTVTSGARLRVGVIGALGRMGTQVCETVQSASDMELSVGIDHDDAMTALTDANSDVLVDFTRPDVVMEHIRFAIDHEVPIIVGTSGFTEERLETIRQWLGSAPTTGVMVVPNFAIGAVLAMSFARQAARFFDSAEIIELHHAGKVDAPSGTALAAARAIADSRSQAKMGAVPDATTDDPDGARGATVDGIHVHAVRMPGLVAHLEVLLGSEGETLTIRHDSANRSSFMPGVLTAIRAVASRPTLTVGLESLLFD